MRSVARAVEDAHPGAEPVDRGGLGRPGRSSAREPRRPSRSAASSPPPTAARSVRTSVRSVPVRLPTVTCRRRPKTRRSTISMSSRSMTTLPTSRVNRTWPPATAEKSKFSPALLPLKARRSAPGPPMTVSLASPGSHWNTSAPSPRSTVSVALVAVDEVVAGAAEEALGAGLPSSVSLPSPPSRVVASVAVNVPAGWTPRACRSRRRLTTMVVTRLRSKANSAVPLPPTSTSSVLGSPDRRRRVMASAPGVPVTVRTSFLMPAFTAAAPAPPTEPQEVAPATPARTRPRQSGGSVHGSCLLGSSEGSRARCGRPGGGEVPPPARGAGFSRPGRSSSRRCRPSWRSRRRGRHRSRPPEPRRRWC